MRNAGFKLDGVIALGLPGHVARLESPFIAVARFPLGTQPSWFRGVAGHHRLAPRVVVGHDRIVVGG
jgi:hypothetical protein